MLWLADRPEYWFFVFSRLYPGKQRREFLKGIGLEQREMGVHLAARTVRRVYRNCSAFRVYVAVFVFSCSNKWFALLAALAFAEFGESGVFY